MQLAPAKQGKGQDGEREQQDEKLQAAGAGEVAGFPDPLQEGSRGIRLDITIVGKSRSSWSALYTLNICAGAGAGAGATVILRCHRASKGKGRTGRGAATLRGRATHLVRICGVCRWTEENGENSRAPKPKRSMTTSMARDVSEPAHKGAGLVWWSATDWIGDFPFYGGEEREGNKKGNQGQEEMGKMPGYGGGYGENENDKRGPD